MEVIMDLIKLAKLALDRDIGEILIPKIEGLIVGIGETGIKKSEENQISIGLPEWNFPKDKIPCEDNSVRILHAYHFLEHLSGEDAIKFLIEVQRVLKIGGVLQFGIPYYNCEIAYQDLTHKSFWTESTFKTLMNNKYYKPIDFEWGLKIQSQCIIGIVERNLMLVGQLLKYKG